MSILMTEREAAAELRVCSNTFRNLVRPELPIIRVGRSVRYPRAAVEEWLEERSQAPATSR